MLTLVVLGSVTLTADEITDADGTFSAYEYDVKGGSSLEQTINSSRETGTTFFEQVLTLNLTKLSKEDNVQIKLLAYGRPQVAVVDNNGNAFLMRVSSWRRCGRRHNFNWNCNG